MKKPGTKIDAGIIDSIHGRLQKLYGDHATGCLSRILQLVDRFALPPSRPSLRVPDQQDVVLITYGDQIQSSSKNPLRSLGEFLTGNEIDQLVSTIHILPFSPWSSDDGFSVIDYRAVDPTLGDWQDIGELGDHFELMFDLVLNHVSTRSDWFQNYLSGKAPFTSYFIEADPGSDLSKVTRPRSLPLLTEFETSRGKRFLWTTFSDDQVDLNFACPDVLVEMLDVLLFYIEQGARIIRLDAVAYLWKRIGSQCIHLPETHQVIKLFRDVINAIAPHVLLLTETNVPHAENVSYFGTGDEAQLVYQFSLPPLLLHALLSGDATPLMKWLAELKPAVPGTAFFNFTASHDGIGMRPLEGLVSQVEIAKLTEQVVARGGLVSTRQQADGSHSPYELNISYVSALAGADGEHSQSHLRRFLTSQGIMLALRGIPAVYFHSLVGTQNDIQAAVRSEQPRRINRRKFKKIELDSKLEDPGSTESRVLQGYRSLLSCRIAQPAFHPDAEQTVVPACDSWLIAFLRTSQDQNQKILILANVSDREQTVDLSSLTDLQFERDLLSQNPVCNPRELHMEAWEMLWLESC